MNRLDIQRSRVGWAMLGVVLAAVLLFVGYSFIGTFVFGVFIYYATRPLYKRLKRRVYPKTLAAAVALLALTLPALALFAYTLAIGIQELNQFAAVQGRDLGQLETFVSQYIDLSQAVEDPSSLLDDPDVIGTIQSILGEANRYLGFLGGALLHLFIMLALAFYLLRDGPRLSRYTVHQFGDDRGVLDNYFEAVDRDFQSIFFGNILNAIITGVIGALAYTGLNYLAPSEALIIPYPFLLGLLTGVASLIPVVGMKLVYIPVALLLVVRSFPEFLGLWFIIVFVTVSFVIVDALPDFVLRPYVSGRNLHVGMVMFAYIFGPLLFGWYGIFLGPMILVLVYHFAKLVLPELLKGMPIQPYAVDPGTVVYGPAPADDHVDDVTPDADD